MSYGTYLKFNHFFDVYQKIVTIGASGQRVVSFSFKETIPVEAQWDQSSISVQPYLSSSEQLSIFVPKDYINNISFDNRLKNLFDKYNNLIDDSYYEITGIQKKMQFNGKIHHLVVSLKLVVESND